MPQILTSGLPDSVANWLAHRLGGIPVKATHSGEETLTALVNNPWSLLIIDSRVTAPNATEVLRRARIDLGQVELPVIYCLEQDRTGDLLRQLVDRLGVDHLLFHPLDGEELARLVAEIIGVQLPKMDTPENLSGQEIKTAVIEVWEQFKDAIIGRVPTLEQAISAIQQGTLDNELQQKARQEAHKLAGSLGSFGFTEGSRLAREIEQSLTGRPPISPSQGSYLAALIHDLRLELDRPPASPAPEPTLGGERCLLLIVDDDVELAKQLVMEASRHGLQATIATDVSQARELIIKQRPDVVLLDLSFPQATEDGLALLSELTHQTPPIPTLVYTVRDGLDDRVAVVQRGGRGFLQKPLPPSQVIKAICQLINRVRIAGTKVMVVDDDPSVLAVLRVLLERHGIQLTTLANPLQFWDTFEKASPDLLVLDVQMPHLSGIELCRIVRNDPHWAGLPVLFLTASTDAETVHRVFAAGADDYMSKPIVGPELITRIINRLERTQLQRSMDEKRRQLEAELARAWEVQAKLLPRDIPVLNGFELEARCIPAQEVAGDFYDWVTPKPDTLKLTLCDVMGKGMPAAILMATARAALRAVVLQHSPAKAVDIARNALQLDLERSNSFITLFHAQLDVVTRHLSYVNAGHGHVFMQRADGTVEELRQSGLPLGIPMSVCHNESRLKEDALVFNPGDTLVLYSDGLIDAVPGRALDHAALSAELTGAASALDMLNRLINLAGLSGPPPDDLTVVILHCKKRGYL